MRGGVGVGWGGGQVKGVQNRGGALCNSAVLTIESGGCAQVKSLPCVCYSGQVFDLGASGEEAMAHVDRKNVFELASAQSSLGPKVTPRR